MSHTSKRPVMSVDTDVLFQNCINFKNVMCFSFKTPHFFFSFYSLLFTSSSYYAANSWDFLLSLDIIESKISPIVVLIFSSQKPNMFGSKLPRFKWYMIKKI